MHSLFPNILLCLSFARLIVESKLRVEVNIFVKWTNINIFFSFLEIEIELFINNLFIYNLNTSTHGVGEGNHITRERIKLWKIIWHILIEKIDNIDLKIYTNIKGNDKKEKRKRKNKKFETQQNVIILLQHFYLNNMSQFNILLFLFMRNEHQNYYENNETIWECPYNI